MLYTITTELPIAIPQLGSSHAPELLVSTLEGYHPAVATAAGSRVAVTITLPAESLEQATRTALAVVHASTGLEAVSVEAMTTDDFDRRAGFEPVPELVSLAEAATLLGKSRQAVQQQVDRGGFTSARKVGSTWIIARGEIETMPQQARHPESAGA